MVRVLSHPLSVWVLYYGVMLAFFLTPICFAMSHMWLMDLINLGFLFGATLFWWPMVGLDPIPRWGRLSPKDREPPDRSAPRVISRHRSSSSRQTIAPMYTLSSTHAGAGVLWVLSSCSQSSP